MSTDHFADLVHGVLKQHAIPDLLNSTHAVILERIARGGGATRWYFCADRRRLPEVEAHLRPGSSVSFYFDGRIQNGTYSLDLLPRLQRIISETGDVVFGVLGDDRVTLTVDFLAGPGELAEATSSLDASVRVFYGPFPGRDNDGVRAVTVDLPDRDGVVRAHPH